MHEVVQLLKGDLDYLFQTLKKNILKNLSSIIE